MTMPAILGPTASGKTRKAVALAKALGGEIVSADSRQVYRGMDLGTGKDLEEYDGIPYHLIDICDAGERYDLHRYVKDFNAAVADIRSRGRLPIVCGGSGMYAETALSGVVLPDVPANEALRAELAGKSLAELTAILQQYKTLHNTTDVDTAKRAVRAIEIALYYQEHPDLAAAADRRQAAPHDACIFVVDLPRDIRRERITQRLHARLEAGMVEEVRGLLARGTPPENLLYYGLEYKFLTLYLLGKLTYEEMVEQLNIAIHQFAKRQMTWLRGMERRGFTLHWLPYDLSDNEMVGEVVRLLGC